MCLLFLDTAQATLLATAHYGKKYGKHSIKKKNLTYMYMYMCMYM